MRKKILKEEYKHEIERLYHEVGLSQQIIAEQYDVCPSTISNFMRDNNIKTDCNHKKNYYSKKLFESDIDNIKNLIDSGFTQNEIGNIYNVDQSSIFNFIKRHNIKYKKRSCTGDTVMNEDDIETVKEMYESGMTQREIADEFDVCGDTIHRFMKNYGLKTRSPPKDRVTDEERVKIYEDWLKGVPLKELRDKYCRSIKTIKRNLIDEYNKRGGIKEGEIK